MPKPTLRLALIGLILIALAVLAWPLDSIATAGAPDPADPDGARLFQEKIAPVLKAECFRCHSAEAEKLRGGLRLDAREAILEGGDSGPAIVPGKSGESLLIQAIRHEDGMAMPPKKPRLSEEIVTDIARWVDLGAPYPAAGVTQPSFSTTIQQARSHWAFQPVKKAVPPPVRDVAWVHNADRRLHPRTAGGTPMASLAAGRSCRLAPSRDLRRDRSPALSRGDRGVRRRSVAGCR